MSIWKRRGPIFGLIIVCALAAAQVFSMPAAEHTRQGSGAEAHAIAGGLFEASGVVFIDDGALFVDDGRRDTLFWMSLDRTGRQVGDVRPVPLGLAVRDMEGITTDGRHIFIVGSQSKKDSMPGVGLVRLSFDRAALRVSQAETVHDLKTLVFAALPDVREAAGRRVDGFNIEGLAWDPSRRQLLLGLRAPVIDGHALVIPLAMRDQREPLSAANIAIEAGEVMRLALGGGGIRSLEFDPVVGRYHVISGSARNAEVPFALWRWSPGAALDRDPVEAPLLARELKPEGITRVTIGGASYRLLVFDSGRYAALR